MWNRVGKRNFQEVGFKKIYNKIGRWENDTAYCGFENYYKDSIILVHL